jgi:RNA-directed DNA polymerase
MPRYPVRACSAKSKARGITADYAWIVNFNNGNANNDNQSNHNYVRACRPRECHPVAADFRRLHAAWRAARRGKKPSPNQLAFDSFWIDGLIDLETALKSGTWSPRPTTCFVARQPKAREIHAPDFADRVVHHWLVPQLEAIYEPIFIHDSYSNRRGKGTHAAVERLKGFVRQVASGQGGGWYLQLDIANCFNSVDRRILWSLLKPRIGGLSIEAQRAAHALLKRSPLEQGVHYVCRPDQYQRVPEHKRLASAPPGCGIAIGNLSSQFLVNVYMNELDQFVKHVLKVKRYVRYVDDFVLVHQSREQLEAWRLAIEQFLGERLRLKVKSGPKLRPFAEGIDFLGYVIYPTHTVVRRRVSGHAQMKLGSWAQRHIVDGRIRATPAQLREIQAVYASYLGHFGHADSHRLQQRIETRFPWLATIFLPRPLDYRVEHMPVTIHAGGKGCEET